MRWIQVDGVTLHDGTPRSHLEGLAVVDEHARPEAVAAEVI